MNHKNTILIAEDDEHLLRIFEKLISGEGFRTLVASNGNEAIELAIRHNPQLILMDVIMPGLSGMEVLKKLRENPLTANIFIVMISSPDRNPGGKLLGLESGADDFLEKPVSNKELSARVRTYIRLVNNLKSCVTGMSKFRL